MSKVVQSRSISFFPQFTHTNFELHILVLRQLGVLILIGISMKATVLSMLTYSWNLGEIFFEMIFSVSCSFKTRIIKGRDQKHAKCFVTYTVNTVYCSLNNSQNMLDGPFRLILTKSKRNFYNHAI